MIARSSSAIEMENVFAVQTVPLSRIAETPLENTFSISIAELDRAIICDLNQAEFESMEERTVRIFGSTIRSFGYPQQGFACSQVLQ
jgi:hypothetical protein